MTDNSRAHEVWPPIIFDATGVSVERQHELEGVATHMLDTFFQGKNLGTTEGPVPGHVWPWVRYLVWDSLKPQFGQGESKYKDAKWRDDGDKYLTDLINLAREVKKVVPENVNAKEWGYLSSTSYEQLLKRVGTDEQDQIILQSLIRMSSDEQIERNFDQWAEIVERFEPRKFVAAIRDQQHFEALLLPVIHHIIISQPPELKSPQQQAIWQEIRQTAANWNDKMRVRLLTYYYVEYATKHGLTKMVSYDDGDSYPVARIPTELRQDGKEELTHNEREEWGVYLGTRDPTRDEVAQTLKQFIQGHEFRFPNLRYVPDRNFEELLYRLSAVPYAFALTFLPDMTDKEASKLFGQTVTATQVKEKAAISSDIDNFKF